MPASRESLTSSGIQDGSGARDNQLLQIFDSRKYPNLGLALTMTAKETDPGNHFQERSISESLLFYTSKK